MALIDKLTNIADAIRGKTGGTDPLTLDAMAEAIAGIETGGGGGSSGGELDTLIDRSITEVYSNATAIGSNAFRNCTELTTAKFPSAKSVGDNAFYYCQKLVTANIPLATSLGNGVFIQCLALEKADFPLVKTITGTETLYGCRKLMEVNMPLLTSIPSRFLQSCYNIPKVDFPVATSIASYAFYDCRYLTAVILRSETMCTLAHTNAINAYHFTGKEAPENPTGAKDGYIYVPRALVEDYKVATNWSTYATQLRALEDYTIDGTITGKLDPSKI